MNGTANFVGDFVQQTTDGGFIVLADTSSAGAGNEDILVLKLDAGGNIGWQQTYGGSGHDWANSVKQTTDDGYVIGGYSDSFNGPEYQGDGWALKLNANGTIAWQKNYGDGGNAVDVGQLVQQTKDGGYILGGWTVAFDASSADIWLLKLNSDGTVDWENTYGGAGYEQIHALRQTADKGYVVTGRTDGFGADGFDAWVLKLNEDGSIAWGKTYGGSSNDMMSAIEETTDHGYILAGYTDTFGAGGVDAWVLKLNANGTVAWEKAFGGPSAEYFSAVQETTDGGFIMVGQTKSFGAGDNDLWLMKLHSNGAIAWQRTYGGSASDIGFSVEQVADGGLIVAGVTESFGGTNPYLWLLKLDSSGQVPSCGLMGSSSAAVTNSSSVIRNANGSAYSSWADVTDTGVLPNIASSQSTVACQFTPPTLAINYNSGSPQSFFTLTGTDFPPTSTATIVLNGNVLTDTLSVDDSGGFEFLLDADQADTGRYYVTATVNPIAMVAFTIDPGAPLRAQEASGPVFIIPGGIAFTEFLHLPLVRR